MFFGWANSHGDFDSTPRAISPFQQSEWSSAIGFLGESGQFEKFEVG